MLVLSAKSNDLIHISDYIEIIILQIDKHRIKLGFNAPDNVKIYRHEIFKRIQLQNKLEEENRIRLFNALQQELLNKEIKQNEY